MYLRKKTLLPNQITMADNYQLPAGDHRISLATAIAMTSRYRQDRLSILADPTNETILPLSETFNKEAVLRLLNTEDATGIRIYYGMTEDKDIHAILVATDAAGQDILPPSGSVSFTGEEEEIILEDALRCPYTCPPESPLNG
jgi:hypothetical protein